MITVSEKKRVVCDSCLEAVLDYEAFDGNEDDPQVATLAIQFGDEIADHFCGGREGDLLDTETCICRCNREDRC